MINEINLSSKVLLIICQCSEIMKVYNTLCFMYCFTIKKKIIESITMLYIKIIFCFVRASKISKYCVTDKIRQLKTENS